MGYWIYCIIYILFSLFETGATPITIQEGEVIPMYYVVNTNDNTDCLAISLYCGSQLISEANLFETLSEIRVDFQIDPEECSFINYSFIKPSCTEWNIGTYITVYGRYDNVVFRFNGVSSTSYTGSFSTMYGFLSGEEWQKSKSKETSEFYFRKEFQVPMEFGAYELRILFRGSLTIELNNRVLVKDEHNSEWLEQNQPHYGLSFIRSGDELIKGLNSLTISLTAEVAPDIDGWLGLYVSSLDTYLYPYPLKFLPNPPTSNLTDFSSLIDQNELTSVQFLPDQLFQIDFGFYRPSFTSIALFVPYDYSFTIRSLMVTSNQEVVLSRPTFHSLRNKEYTTFLMKTDVYSGLSFYFETKQSLALYEIQFHVGRHTVHEVVIYEKEIYSLYTGFHPLVIYPVESLVENCHSDGVNPMIMIDMHCVIRVNPRSEGIFPLTLKNDDNTIVGNITISIQNCEHRIIRSFRFLGDNSIPSETITMYDSGNHIVLSMNSRYPFGSEKEALFLCLEPDVYRIVVDDFVKEAWHENSYFQFDESFWGTYVFYMRFRFDRRLNLPTEWMLDIRQNLPVASYWYCYSQRLIPSLWYDQSIDGWTYSTYEQYPSTEGQFQLFKRSVVVDDIDVNMMEIIIHFQSACIIVLNERELYRVGIPGDSMTNSTTATSHSTEAISHRIRVRVSLQTNENWIAIALIHHTMDSHISHFDASIRFFLETKSLRMDDCQAYYSSTSGRNPGDLIVMDSWKRAIWKTIWGRTEHRITWLQTNADYLNCIELHTTLTDANRLSDVLGPTVFSIEARQDVSENYDLLYNSSSVYWPRSRSVQSFCFDPYKNYRNFRYYMNSQYASFQVFSLRTYSVIEPSIYTIEYEYTYLVIDYLYTCIQPTTPYLTNYTASDLPFGMGIDSGNGCLFGEVKSLFEPLTVYITSYTADHTPVKSSLLFTIINCTSENNLFVLSVYSLSHDYIPIRWSVENEHTEETILSGLVLTSSQSLTNIPMCLGNQVYSFTLSYTTKDNRPLEAEVSIELYRTKHIFFTAYLSTLPNPFQFFINAQLSLTAKDEWRYLNPVSIPTNWNDPSYDASEWQQAVISSIQPTYRLVLFRKTIYIPQYHSYNGYSILLQYKGGIAMYINGKLFARYNLNSQLSNSSLPITPYTTLQTTVLNINLVNTMETDSIFIGIFYCRQENEFPLSLDITGRAVIDGESMSSSMSIFLFNSDMMKTIHNGIQSYYVLNMLSFPTVAFNWEFQNMELMHVNTLYIQTSAVENLLITLYCTNFERSEGFYLLTRYRVTHTNYQASHIPVDKANLSCNQYTVLLSSDYVTHYSFKLYDIYLYYDLTYEDTFCGRTGELNAVKEGHISPVFCMNPQHGYMYSICTKGRFTPFYSENCFTPIPSSITYPIDFKSIAIGAPIPDIVPNYSGTISHFFTYEQLPDGLYLHPDTGVLSGYVNATSPAKRTIRIFGNNGNITQATVSTQLTLDYSFYTCPKEGMWESNVTVSHTAIFSCGASNHGIGITRKHCSITYNDAFWDFEEMNCISKQHYFQMIFSTFVIISLVPSLFRFCIRLFKKYTKKEV